MKSREDSSAKFAPASAVQKHCFFLKIMDFAILTFVDEQQDSKIHRLFFLFLAGISPWDLWSRIKHKKLVCKAARIAPQTSFQPR